MSRLIVRNGRLLDPSQELDLEPGQAEVLIEDGRIATLATGGEAIPGEGAEIVDAAGAWIAPGLVDLHAHLREPGLEYKEDLASGGTAAVAGGFTQVACMPNTDPVNDDPSVTKYILDRAEKESPARIRVIAAATRGLRGEVMTEMMALKEAGAVAFSDDGSAIMDSGVMRRVLEYSRMADAPVVVHAEDVALRGGGVVNEGPVATRLGLPGNPAAAEEIMVARDVRLASLTGAHLHVGHVSTAGAVHMIRKAREAGIRVTAEVTPHHLTLTDEATTGFDTSTRVAPPLRAEADVRALRAALAEGVIDMIVSDHAPHATHEKEVEFTEAPPGMIGLETAVSVCLELVRDGTLSPLEFVRRLSTEGARVFGLEGGTLREGAPGDVVLIDPEREWTYDPAQGFSKSRNSPWAGTTFTGRVTSTIVDGRLVYDFDRGVLIR